MADDAFEALARRRLASATLLTNCLKEAEVNRERGPSSIPAPTSLDTLSDGFLARLSRFYLVRCSPSCQKLIPFDQPAHDWVVDFTQALHAAKRAHARESAAAGLSLRQLGEAFEALGDRDDHAGSGYHHAARLWAAAPAALAALAAATRAATTAGQGRGGGGGNASNGADYDRGGWGSDSGGGGGGGGCGSVASSVESEGEKSVDAQEQAGRYRFGFGFGHPIASAGGGGSAALSGSRPTEARAQHVRPQTLRHAATASTPPPLASPPPPPLSSGVASGGAADAARALASAAGYRAQAVAVGALGSDLEAFFQVMRGGRGRRLGKHENKRRATCTSLWTERACSQVFDS